MQTAEKALNSPAVGLGHHDLLVGEDHAAPTGTSAVEAAVSAGGEATWTRWRARRTTCRVETGSRRVGALSGSSLRTRRQGHADPAAPRRRASSGVVYKRW